MSTDYGAYAVIGQRLQREELFREEPVRAFDHDFGQDIQYDPQTGQKLWKLMEVPIRPELDITEGENCINWRHSRLNLVWGSCDRCYIGITVGRHIELWRGMRDERKELKDTIESVRERLQDKLGELYKEHEFGLWAVLTVG